MKSILYLLLIIFIIPTITLAQGWKVETDVSAIQTHYKLEGYIDSTYKITMVLKRHNSPFLCGHQDKANRWQNFTQSGWYMYDQIGTKIPLIGANASRDGDHFIKLYVPENYTDTLNKKDCALDSIREIFFNTYSYSPTRMYWSKHGHKDTLEVNLTYVERRNLRTKALINLYFYDWPIKEIDISKLSNLESIDKINIIDAKQLNNNYYITFEFGQRSMPGSPGSGHCGMGYEGFIGYLHLNKEASVLQFESRQVTSCLNSNNVEPYEIVEGKPELGLVKKEE